MYGRPPAGGGPAPGKTGGHGRCVTSTLGGRIVVLDSGERRRFPAWAGLLATNRPLEGALSPTVPSKAAQRCAGGLPVGSLSTN